MQAQVANWPYGESSMARRIRTYDWASTVLGAIESWPQSQKTAIDIVLAAGQPMQLVWGPDRIVFFNDAYGELLEDPHRSTLGLPLSAAWPDLWVEIEPLVKRVSAGETERCGPIPLAKIRHGYPDDTWRAFSFSSVRDESGTVAGLLNVAVDALPLISAERAAPERGQEKSFARRFRASPVPFLVMKPDAPLFTITEVNDAFLAATTRIREEVIGRGIFEVFPDDPIDDNPTGATIAGMSTLRASLQRVLTSHQPDRVPGLKYELARPDGTFEERWWSSVNSPVLDEQGEVEAIIHNAIDVTEEHPSEEALRESEKRFYALFAASPVPFMVLAPNPPDFTITAANEAYYAATVTTPEILIGRRLFDAFPDDKSRTGELGSEALERSLNRVLTTRRTDTMGRVRYDLATPDGFTPHWWEAMNAPILDASGEVSAIIHQVNRVTELHLAEGAERKNQERQAFLLKLSDALRPLGEPAAIKAIATGLLGEFLGVNRAFYADAEAGRWLVTRGYESDIEPLPDAPFEMATYGQWVIDDFRAGRRLVVTDITTDPRFHELEKAFHQHLQIAAEAALPLVKDGALLAMFVVHSSKPRHWSPEELILLDEVAERTWAAVQRARAEEALRESEQRLLAAVGERDALLKEVHHRVKNNLQVITSLLEMQARQVEEPRSFNLFMETRNRVGAIASIHELLYRAGSFSQIDLVASVRQLAEYLVSFYRIEDRVKVTVDGDGVNVELDRAVPLGLLFNELISNACKHAFPFERPGSLTIHIGFDGDNIQCELSDTGVGMPPELDLQNPSSLGLQIVHTLAVQLHGNLRITSGSGTRVLLSIPR